ncbi:MAG: DeoR family transcriptional regulator, partial [Bacteroidaceae bacterium]|nr:DeoR family transcriptional regulator [Bacteroidaceae bacterium]
NREVIGLNDSKKLLEDIPNKIVNYMGLVVDVNLYEQNGLDYIELIVNPSNVPISFKGKYYYRSGSTMQELNGAALQQFIMKKMGKSWDDVANENATFDDIDREAINYFLRKGIEANRIPEYERNASTKDVLTSLHLLDENGHLKNAALLLFGKDPLKFFTSVRFKIGRFGVDEADLLIQDVIEGNIIQMADRVVEVLKAKYLTSPVRFDGMQRKEELEVPIEALREMLYNSITHKDYTGADIQMHVYNDHVEIWNDGELPEGYDEKVLYDKHSSKPRNRNIADTMFKAGFIDTWGRGYKKIHDGFEEVGLPMPTVKSHCGGTLVTFQRGYDVVSGRKNVSSDVTSLSPVQLTERQKKICDLIDDDAFISGKKMSLVLSVDLRTIRRDIAAMQKKGVLLREGNTSAGRWVVIRK